MDIKQVRSDFDNGVLLSRCTVAELIEFAEHAVAVIAGRQQAIGALNMRVAELEQRAVNVPRVPSNPAAHDWAAPSGTIDSDEFGKLESNYLSLTIDASSPTSFDMYSVRLAAARAAFIANIDASLTAQLAINRSLADQLTSAEMDCMQLHSRLTRVIGEKPQWLPIETAPLDGSHVLCYAPELQFVGFYGARCWSYMAPGVPNAPTQPTHWMPLPAAPAMSAAESEANP